MFCFGGDGGWGVDLVVQVAAGLRQGGGGFGGGSSCRQAPSVATGLCQGCVPPVCPPPGTASAQLGGYSSLH